MMWLMLLITALIAFELFAIIRLQIRILHAVRRKRRMYLHAFIRFPSKFKGTC